MSPRFTFDPDAAGAGDRKARQLDYEVDQLHSGIGRWCRAHYPEALEAWVHLKVIRAFVESILRYGLPRNFCALVLRPRPRMEGRLERALQGMFAHVGGGALKRGARRPARWSEGEAARDLRLPEVPAAGRRPVALPQLLPPPPPLLLLLLPTDRGPSARCRCLRCCQPAGAAAAIINGRKPTHTYTHKTIYIA
ncbi:unnamed protein product, partial [Heterosigma akashiwo]